MDGRYAVMRVKGTKRTGLGALLMSVLLIVPIALRAVAAPNDGVASTSLSLISLTINGQTVDVAFGEGTATNESAVSSEVAFTAAAVSVDGDISTSVGHASASADSSTPHDSDADATVPFDIPGAAAGSVTFEGVVAEADESAKSARSTLGQATLDADVADSFVGLTGVSIGNLQEVTTSTASASEGVSISNLFLVPLRKFLERLTTLSADDLIAFAAAVGGDFTADELALVEAQRQEAISEINMILAPLSGLGISPLPADASVQEILDYVAACSSDPLLDPVCDSIEAVVSDLRDAVEALNTKVGEQPLISINALSAGVSSEADDTSSSSTSQISWGDAQVAGEVILTQEDYEEAMDLLIGAVQQVETALRNIPGLEELEIGVTRLFLDKSTEPVGSRKAASSSLNFLRVAINVPESTNVPAPLVASLNVMAMGAAAEHEPGATEEPPPPDNRPPVAEDDVKSTPQDTPVDISVLANDSDPDGDEITVFDYTQPSNGTVNCENGVCTYTPNPGFYGTDTFTYTITDPYGLQSTATVTITVTRTEPNADPDPDPTPDPDPDPNPNPDPGNDPPVAVDDEATTPEGTPVGIPVMENDSDPDGDDITVVDTTQPSNGTVTCEDGVCTYTPNPSFTGTDTFDYTISDPFGGSATATVTITVGGPVDDLGNPIGNPNTTGNEGDNPSVQGPPAGPLGPPGTQGNPGSPGITSQSTSDCDGSCPLANTGFDLKYSFVGLFLIAAGFALCRSLRSFA